jgi:hypothetical protein
MITKSSFLDETKMTTTYIKTKVTRTDIHTDSHVVSIDNARYECPGLSRAYERRVQSGTSVWDPENHEEASESSEGPIASTIEVLF